MALPIAQLTSAKTPEQAAAVVRSWTQPVNPDELDPLDRFITRRELLDVFYGDMPAWAVAEGETPEGETPEGGASAQAGTRLAEADAQSEPAPKRTRKPKTPEPQESLELTEDEG